MTEPGIAAQAPEEKLAALGLTLPPVAAPLAAYVPAVRTGSLIYTAGQLPVVDGKLLSAGKVGAEVGAGRGGCPGPHLRAERACRGRR